MKLYEAKLFEDEDINKMVQSSINSSLFLITQTHFWHWQTKSYAEHTALGEFYNTLQTQVDALAEIFMGAGGNFSIETTSTLVPYEKNDAIQTLTSFKQNLSNTEKVLMQDENYAFHGTGDALLDIIKETEKLLYLLTLK